MCGISLRNTRLLRGRAPGSRNAGDSASRRRDGTVRPDAAMARWPSGEFAYSMKAHVAALFFAAFGMR